MNKQTTSSFRAYTRSALITAITLLSVISSQAQTIIITNMWGIRTDEGREYVTSATDIERGVAYNPFTDKGYIVSRSNATAFLIAAVNGSNGSHWGSLSTTGISGGDAVVNQIGVADDGSIYAANLTTASGTRPFRIYRWPMQGEAPILVYAGNPAGTPSIRFGDAIDVRGSGTNTEIIAITGGTAATNLVAIFRPVDDTLTRFTNTIVLISGVGTTDFAKTVAFGTNNTFYAKNTGSSNVRHCSYNWLEGGLTNGGLIRTISVASQIAGIAVDNTNNLLAGVATANATTPHYLIVYDITTTPPTVLYTNSMPGPFAANNNVTAAVDLYGNRIIAVDAKNGVQMASIFVDTNPVPPSITAQPGNITIVNGGYGHLTAGAGGTKPLSYQWLLDGNPIANATNTQLLLTNVTAASAGEYSVQVTNVAGTTLSQAAIVTVSPAVLSRAMTELWRLGPNSGRSYINTDGTQRGLAYNAARNHVLLVTRSGGNAVYVLDGETGDEMHTLNLTGVTGGTFAISMIACTSLGEVYAANLTTGAGTTPFKIYKWVNDDAATVPTVVWSGDPGAGVVANQRWGDNFTVRGAGLGAEILAATRSTNWVALFFGLDSQPQFPASPIHVAAATNGAFGLSVSFGAGDTFWGKSAGAPLFHVAYDINSATGTILKTNTSYPLMSVIGAQPENGFVAGVVGETPNNVRLLDVETDPYTELDTDFFATDNENGNGTGQVVFGPNRLFVLDSNNGIIAFAVGPKLRKSINGNSMTLTWSGTYTLQASGTVTGGWTNVPNAVSGHVVNTTGGQVYYRLVQ